MELSHLSTHFYFDIVSFWPSSRLENSTLSGPTDQSLFPLDTTWQVDQDVNPDDLEDRALPHEEQSPEDAVNGTSCVSVPVAVDLSARQLGLR